MKYSVWLSLALNFGSPNTKRLLEHFKSAQNIYNAEAKDLLFCDTLSRYEQSRLKNKSLAEAEKIIAYSNRLGIKIVSLFDKDYPLRLKSIPNPPVCLYYVGSLPDFDKVPAVCIVGTRKADDYSCRAAWSLSARLTLANVHIVSGGALGIDSSAHLGALNVKGTTTALLPCGINYPYLQANTELRKNIAKYGCIISEFPPDYPVKKGAFHLRNRILSGLTLGTVVIEAGEKSGALITARNALEQGRDVFVITGKPDDKKYAGSNSLLRDGAIPVFNVEDILCEYNSKFGNIIDFDRAVDFDLNKLYSSLYKRSNNADKTVFSNKKYDVKNDISKKVLKKSNETLSKNAEIVYNYLDKDIFIVDELVDCGLPVSDIFSAITELEINGLIVAVPGGRYSINQ